MGRPAWDGVRVRRLSPGALSLLLRLCSRDSRIAFSQREGTFRVVISSTVHEQVQERLVATLVSPRLITRDKATVQASYTITDYGREVMQQYLDARCAALGHDPETCDRQECTAYIAET